MHTHIHTHTHWMVTQWNMFYGMMNQVSLWQSDGRVWIWQMPGEHFLPDWILLIEKFGGGQIIVWGFRVCHTSQWKGSYCD